MTNLINESLIGFDSFVKIPIFPERITWFDRDLRNLIFLYNVKNQIEKYVIKVSNLHLLQAYLHPPGNLSIYSLSDLKADNSLIEHSARAVEPLQIDLDLSPVIGLVPAFSVTLYPLHHTKVRG